jgi:hypothetical protein
MAIALFKEATTDGLMCDAQAFHPESAGSERADTQSLIRLIVRREERKVRKIASSPIRLAVFS